MEIRIQRRLTGRSLRDEILERYGSVEELERRAEEGDAVAWNDLADLRLFEEDPRRLGYDMTVTTIGTLTAEELDLLTPTRMALLNFLATADEPHNVTELAEALGRDKKNVSEDLDILEELGLVETRREGRERLSRPLGNDIHIVLGRT